MFFSSDPIYSTKAADPLCTAKQAHSPHSCFPLNTFPKYLSPGTLSLAIQIIAWTSLCTPALWSWGVFRLALALFERSFRLSKGIDESTMPFIFRMTMSSCSSFLAYLLASIQTRTLHGSFLSAQLYSIAIACHLYMRYFLVEHLCWCTINILSFLSVNIQNIG